MLPPIGGRRPKAGDGTVYGRIVNTSSEAGLAGPVGQANYGAAKAGITALTLSAARALERYGVRANAIAPRARTAMTADVFGDAPELADGQIDPLSPDHVVNPRPLPCLARRRKGLTDSSSSSMVRL